MASKRQNLQFQVGANTSRFKKEMGGVKSLARNTSMQMAGMFAGAFSVGAIIYGTKKIIDSLDDIGKKSARLGISTDFMQKLAFASERSGSSMESVEKAIKTMQKTIYDAGSGLETYNRYFRDLGVSYEDLKGKSPEQQFLILIDALNKVKDASTKSALAQKIFGRSGSELIPMLKDYSSLASELEGRGGIVSEEQVKAAENFKDEITNLTTTLQALIANSGFLEWLAKIVKTLDSAVSKIKELPKAVEEITTASELIKSGQVKTRLVEDGYELAPNFGGGGFTLKKKFREEMYTDPITQDDIKRARMKLKIDNALKSKESEKQKEEENTRKQSLPKETKTPQEEKGIKKLQQELGLLILKLKFDKEELELEKLKLEYAEKIKNAKNDEEKGILNQQLDAELQLLEKNKERGAQDRLGDLKSELDMLKLKNKYSGDELEKEKLKLEYAEKIKNAKSSKEKQTLKDMYNEEFKSLEMSNYKDKLGKLDEKPADSLQRIGVNIGNNSNMLSEKLSKERNLLLKQMRNSLSKLENKNNDGAVLG